jgi:hypothetical protein
MNKNDFLKPSPFSAPGFLGTDTRPFEEIVSADQEVLKQFGVSKKQLVVALKKTFQKTQAGLGNPIEVKNRLFGVYHESRGTVPSPFPGEGAFEKGEAEIYNKEHDPLLRITPLSIHLIEKHCFFQGIGSLYRIDPKTAIEFLMH